RKVDIFRLRQVRFVPVQPKVGSIELDVPATSAGSSPTQVVTSSNAPSPTDSSDRPSTPPPSTNTMPGTFTDTPARLTTPPPRPSTPPTQSQSNPDPPPAPKKLTQRPHSQDLPYQSDDELEAMDIDEDGNQRWQEWGNTWPEAIEDRRNAREEARQANSQLQSEASSSQPQPRRSKRENKGKPPGEWWKSSGSAYTAFTGIPTTYLQAMKSLDSSKWIAAMQEEHQRMIDLKVWEELDPSEMPDNRTCVNAGWVYTTKNHADGTIERYKARLVAKGHSQQAGIDYNETYAPVTRYDTLRFVIAVATNLNLNLDQLDIKTAFLYGNLDEEVWMNPPPAICLDGKDLHLMKSHYGYKRATMKSYEKLSSVLARLGFSLSAFDPCVYFFSSEQTFIVVYVDHIRLSCTNLP